jgi:hypothetical protein
MMCPPADLSAAGILISGAASPFVRPMRDMPPATGLNVRGVAL